MGGLASKSLVLVSVKSKIYTFTYGNFLAQILFQICFLRHFENSSIVFRNKLFLMSFCFKSPHKMRMDLTKSINNGKDVFWGQFDEFLIRIICSCLNNTSALRPHAVGLWIINKYTNQLIKMKLKINILLFRLQLILNRIKKRVFCRASF